MRTACAAPSPGQWRRSHIVPHHALVVTKGSLLVAQQPHSRAKALEPQRRSASRDARHVRTRVARQGRGSVQVVNVVESELLAGAGTQTEEPPVSPLFTSLISDSNGEDVVPVVIREATEDEREAVADLLGRVFHCSEHALTEQQAGWLTSWKVDVPKEPPARKYSKLLTMWEDGTSLPPGAHASLVVAVRQDSKEVVGTAQMVALPIEEYPKAPLFSNLARTGPKQAAVKSFAFVANLAVDSAARRRGVGSLMIRHCGTVAERWVRCCCHSCSLVLL
eukprot:scaffold50_cov420-Prasinococcus_capsulatus_cf.AAC.7